MAEKKIRLTRPNMIQVTMPLADYEKIKPYAVAHGIADRGKLIRRLFKQSLVIK